MGPTIAEPKGGAREIEGFRAWRRPARLQHQPLRPREAEEAAVGRPPDRAQADPLRHLVAHLRDAAARTTIATPICADLMTISLVRRPVV